MALNTRDKRASAVHLALPWRGQYPVASGTIDAAARQIAALFCNAIAAAAPTASTLITTRMSALHLMCPWRGIYPIPDGAINASDRSVASLLYYRAPFSTAPSSTALLREISISIGIWPS